MRHMKRKNLNKYKRMANGSQMKKWANGQKTFSKGVKRVYFKSIKGVKSHPYITSVSLGSITLGAGLLTTFLLMRRH